MLVPFSLQTRQITGSASGSKVSIQICNYIKDGLAAVSRPEAAFDPSPSLLCVSHYHFFFDVKQAYEHILDIEPNRLEHLKDGPRSCLAPLLRAEMT